MTTISSDELVLAAGGMAAGWRCALKTGAASGGTFLGTYYRDQVFYPRHMLGPKKAGVLASFAGLATMAISKDCPLSE